MSQQLLKTIFHSLDLVNEKMDKMPSQASVGIPNISTHSHDNVIAFKHKNNYGLFRFRRASTI